MTNITIRQANPDDYDRVIGDIDDWWGGREMTLMLPRLFFTHFRPWTYVAVRDSAIVGFIAGFQSQTTPTQVYCHFIGVDPKHRGQGIGEALYHRLFSHAAALSCEEVLAVTAPTNRASIDFHTRVGFEIISGSCGVDAVPYATDYDGPGEDRVRFRIALRDHLARSGPMND